MTIEAAIEILQQTVWTSFTVVSPLLAAAIVIGLAISLIQTVTSIQEQTLTFVPKLLGVSIVAMMIANWMLRTVVEFASQMFSQIANIGA